MKFLFICAHPDDLEVFVGNFLTSLAKIQQNPQYLRYIMKDKDLMKSEEFARSITVFVASMTRGEMSDFTDVVKSTRSAAKIRTHELTQSMHHLGINQIDFFGYFDGFVRVSEKCVNQVKEYIVKIRPDFIIAPEPIYTWYLHPDHVRTGKIVYWAVQRMIKEQNLNPYNPPIPHIYYFPALSNQYYFPVIPSFKNLIESSLHSHASQANLLIIARLARLITNFLHGRKIPQFWLAEALRRQYIPKYDRRDAKKRLRPRISLILTLFYRLAYLITGGGAGGMSKRLSYYDGTI
jgi:LmbE family N-acetylglucosaminyl deacetylase